MDVPIACIDAGSIDLELIICLQFPVSVLALTYPVQEDITGVDEERLEDWISELSNQLIGRIKNKLLAHNCRVDLGLPTSYFGSDVSHLLSENGEIMSVYFDVDGETCAFHISIEVFEDDMVFTLDEAEDTDSLGDGELEMF
jgi:CheY-specific phosphatase CheX